ncbi:hypothetical protein ACQP3L_34200, partial [Escherichia coli]
ILLKTTVNSNVNEKGKPMRIIAGFSIGTLLGSCSSSSERPQMPTQATNIEKLSMTTKGERKSSRGGKKKATRIYVSKSVLQNILEGILQI